MTPHQAAVAWQKRQARILADTYAKAWQTGAANYRSAQATPSAAKTTAPPPTKPQAAPMGRALGPALTSLANLAAQLATLVPGPGQTLAAALKAFVIANAWKLAAGASAAWAGEQHGYAQASDADGLLLRWVLDAGAHHCSDCPALAALPPMPLAQWPTLPGDGMTECSAGCKCSMTAIAVVAPVPLTPAQQDTVARIGNRQPVLVAA